MPGSNADTDTGRLLLILGGVIALVGLLLVLGARIPFLGRLPGDLFFQRDGLTIVVPLATSLVISVHLTVILNVLARIFHH